MQCPQCHSENPTEARVCRACGASLTGAPALLTASQAAPLPSGASRVHRPPRPDGAAAKAGAPDAAIMTAIPLREPRRHRRLWLMVIVFGVLGVGAVVAISVPLYVRSQDAEAAELAFDRGCRLHQLDNEEAAFGQFQLAMAQPSMRARIRAYLLDYVRKQEEGDLTVTNRLLDRLEPDWRDSPEVIGKLAEYARIIKSGRDTWQRKAAVVRLGEMGNKRSLRVLIRTLLDWDLRESAVEALDRIDRNWRRSDEAAELIPLMVEAVRWDQPDGLGHAAIRALGAVADRRGIYPLVMSTIEGGYVADHAVESLRAIDRDWTFSAEAAEAAKDLANLLTHFDEHVRRGAAEALGRLKSTAATGRLIELVGALDDGASRAAAEALSRMDPNWGATEAGRKIFPKLLAALEDEKGFHGRLAAELLGHLGDRRAIEPLKNVIEHRRDYSLSRTAKETLKKFGVSVP